MTKIDIMYKFLKRIKRKHELTAFIAYIFNYKNFNDYNYIWRIIKNDDSIIIDIYDNISNHRFNRYIFAFSSEAYKTIDKEGSGVFITAFDVNNIEKTDNKLAKFAYLFSKKNNSLIEYASSFLDRTYVDILKEIIK